MKKVKVGNNLQGLSVAAKVEYAHAVVIAMTSNANFPSPSPSLSVITGAANSLDNAITAATDRSRLHVLQQHTAEDALETLLAQLALYVENASNNDAAKILSSGMSVKHNASTPQVLPAPLGVNAANTVNEGEVLVSWKRVKNAHSYVIELSDDVAATAAPTTSSAPLPTASSAKVFIAWSFGDVVTRCKCVLHNLGSATKYAFRVYAVGSAGKSNRSASVVVKVL